MRVFFFALKNAVSPVSQKGMDRHAVEHAHFAVVFLQAIDSSCKCISVLHAVYVHVASIYVRVQSIYVHVVFFVRSASLSLSI